MRIHEQKVVGKMRKEKVLKENAGADVQNRLKMKH